MQATADQYEISRERIHAARLANQDRAAERQWARSASEPTREEVFFRLVGQLNRDGKTVFYINLRNGKTKEGNTGDLIDFLFRNGYA